MALNVNNSLKLQFRDLLAILSEMGHHRKIFVIQTVAVSWQLPLVDTKG